MTIPAFLRQFAATARALWLGRTIGTEGWALHRQLDVWVMTDGQMADMARIAAHAKGLN